ncbi:hypothetical protein PQR62_25505 [Herbaspirillum lusitanum]|uniref:Uncharacterized protein n=1 Tax=Herbaspirillum lusitanum TaxID=213312 RepID=A0ABW9AFG3_9BURK
MIEDKHQSAPTTTRPQIPGIFDVLKLSEHPLDTKKLTTLQSNVKQLLVLLIFSIPLSAQATGKDKIVNREIIYTEEMASKLRGYTGIHYVACRFRFSDSRRAILEDPNNFVTDHPIRMKCYSSDAATVNDGWAKFNSGKRLWEAYFSGNERNRELLSKGTKVYQLQAINSQGYVVTVDDINGDPKTRDREMYFCLVRPPKAICGQGRAMRLSKPKSDFLPLAMEILRSVEFIDD